VDLSRARIHQSATFFKTGLHTDGIDMTGRRNTVTESLALALPIVNSTEQYIMCCIKINANNAITVDRIG